MRGRRIPSARVAIIRNADESKAVAEALDLLDFGKTLNAFDTIALTVNWVCAKPPETADVVGDVTLRGIIGYFKALKPKRIVVAAGSGGGDTIDVMKTIGYDSVIRETGVDFVDLNEGPFIDLKLDHNKPSSTYLNRLFDEMTFHASFTQLKIHDEATMSASIKNMALSWPPSSQHGAPKKDLGIHENLHGFVAEMARHVPIDLSIISASPAMVATGPHNGIAVHSDMVVCGTDPVAADTIGARLLGFRPQAVHYLYALGNDGIGVAELDDMEIFGMSIKEAEDCFCQSAYKACGFIVDK